MIKKSKVKKSKKPVAKGKKTKKARDTGGFPDMIAVTKETDDDGEYYAVHPITFDDINKDTVVGVYRFKRPTQVRVIRKIQRTPKE